MYVLLLVHVKDVGSISVDYVRTACEPHTTRAAAKPGVPLVCGTDADSDSLDAADEMHQRSTYSRHNTHVRDVGGINIPV